MKCEFRSPRVSWLTTPGCKSCVARWPTMLKVQVAAAHRMIQQQDLFLFLRLALSTSGFCSIYIGGMGNLAESDSSLCPLRWIGKTVVCRGGGGLGMLSSPCIRVGSGQLGGATRAWSSGSTDEPFFPRGEGLQGSPRALSIPRQGSVYP